ncbi:MAG: hypothetical protein AAFV53_05005 [Myxococcota bacterium]
MGQVVVHNRAGTEMLTLTANQIVSKNGRVDINAGTISSSLSAGILNMNVGTSRSCQIGAGLLQLSGQGARIACRNKEGRTVLEFDEDAPAGDFPPGAKLALSDRTGRPCVQLSPAGLLLQKNGVSAVNLNTNGDLYLGSKTNTGSVVVRGTQGQSAIALNGQQREISATNQGRKQTVVISAARKVQEMETPGGEMRLYDENGAERLSINPDGIYLRHQGEDSMILKHALLMLSRGRKQTVVISAARKVQEMETPGGEVKLYDENRAERLSINPDGIYLRHQGEDSTILKHALLMLGRGGQGGQASIFNKAGKRTIFLDGNRGDILLENADCCEDFDVIGLGLEPELEAGAVVRIADDGRLELARTGNDPRAAGVISGAGRFAPGIRLDHHDDDRERLPVALVGKVSCKVDAQYGSVRPGDLLVSSPTPGHAMRAPAEGAVLGAVIGKALEPLAKGCGLIAIFVTRQ